ncbi:MAG: biotin--[acetyl-CoA-carboxylase] ligase [Burkholderiales bacterium]|nr:biotin--[acetyl-CoA-carboxylase] ligase [Burkholderiales bacterium]
MHPGTFAVFRVLADGAPRDVAGLCAATGLASVEVRAACEDLADLGAPLVAEGGRYRLADPVEPLDAAAIAALGGGLAQVEVVPVCESTNTLAMERARAGAASGTTIACEIQTAGRGRRGNRWAAPPGASVALSMVWRFDDLAASLAGLSLAAGVACAEALERLGATGVGVKWPNDLVAAGAKLGGILVEVAGGAVVVGVGINLRLPAAVRAAQGQPVTDLASLGTVPGRNALVAATAGRLAAALARFAREGFGGFREAWAARHALHGKRVRVLPAEGVPVEGRALGVGEDGALLVETERGVERFISGEVSLRAAA